MLNERSPEVIVEPQHREPAASNFQILGVELEEEFTKLASKLASDGSRAGRWRGRQIAGLLRISGRFRRCSPHIRAGGNQ